MEDDTSVEGIRALFMAGLATEGQYAEAPRGYQDAVEDTKSPERGAAQSFHQFHKSSPAS